MSNVAEGVAISNPFEVTSSRTLQLTRALLILTAILALAVLTALPLGWKEQAMFGGTLIALAVVLHVTFRSQTVTLALMTISVFATVRYGYWRSAQTWEGMTSAGHLRQWDLIFVLLLLGAEFYAFATLILGYFQTLRPLGRRPVALPSEARRWPTVDVFIPTYNEPLSVVRATVLAALAIDYPAHKMNVIVLDDGRRDEFRDFAAAVGVGYLTRETNAHAKAGNINHALEHTHGEFIAIFDADHIPTQSFLRMTLGWFVSDPRVGLVQTPHHFYSPDPFERNLGRFRKVPNEGELFHRLVQDGNDLWNASFFCGSCAVLRREALEAIGGTAVETVTEDAHTALRLHRAGWRTAYVNIPLAAGLATESLASHIGQRVRWARGMVQILRLENPLFRRGLSAAQRLCYFNATTHFLFALPRLVFLTVPLVYLLFGRVNIYGYSLAVFAYALPHIVLSHVATSRSQRQYRFSFWNEIYEAVLAPYILLPTLLALINPRLGRFNVTSKGGIIHRSYFDLRIAFPLVCLLALNVAGLFMARHRYLTDPAHHDTVIMNVVWTIYNIVILSVATSVALERRQRRSEVRVDLQAPLTVLTPDGRHVTGMTSQLSRGGATAHFDGALGLSAGSQVVLTLRDRRARCNITARIVGSNGQTAHLAFLPLELQQEKFLLSLAFSRSEAWLAWHSSRKPDRPLRSGVEILALAVRGLTLVIGGSLWAGISAPVIAQSKRARRRAATVGGLVVILGLYPTGAEAQQPDAFQETYQLGAMPGSPNGVVLRGPRAVENVFFDVPVTKIIREATLELRYESVVPPKQAVLELWLNGTRVADLSPVPGLDTREVVSLPTDLLTTANTLSFRLRGTCAACGISPAPWITVRSTTAFHFSGSRLPLANDLSLLPVPFLDAIGERSSIVPVAFSDAPDTETLQAAAIVASWFGVFSDVRGVRFPVTVGDLPMGNGLVFATRGSALEALLPLPAEPAALVAVRDNPRDPYGKLLIVTAARPEDLISVARTLVTRDRFAPHTDVLPAGQVATATRRSAYDAPRWLTADGPAPIGTYTSAERLTIKGAGSVNIYVRIPPDLFLSARQSVPLRLKYEYAGVSGRDAALHVRLNDQDVESVRLPTGQPGQHADTVWLPTGRLRPYANTLTIDFDPGRDNLAGDAWPTVAIRRDSSIDLRGLPHSVILPRLELFADAGYPFTAWADLGRTAVVMPETPARGAYEALLNIAGAFGGQTGLAASAITVATPTRLEAVRDKDLIVLGTPATQPLLGAWAARLPLQPSGRGVPADGTSLWSRLLHPEWPFRTADRDRLMRFVANGLPADTVIEQFVSPMAPGRSVVAIVPRELNNYAHIPDVFMPAVRNGPVYGGVALALNGRFQSFLVGSLAYRSGDLDSYERAMVFLFEHYWLLPLLVFAPAFVLAFEIRRVTERVAARRSAVPSTVGAVT